MGLTLVFLILFAFTPAYALDCKLHIPGENPLYVLAPIIGWDPADGYARVLRFDESSTEIYFENESARPDTYVIVDIEHSSQHVILRIKKSNHRPVDILCVPNNLFNKCYTFGSGGYSVTSVLPGDVLFAAGEPMVIPNGKKRLTVQPYRLHRVVKGEPKAYRCPLTSAITESRQLKVGPWEGRLPAIIIAAPK